MTLRSRISPLLLAGAILALFEGCSVEDDPPDEAETGAAVGTGGTRPADTGGTGGSSGQVSATGGSEPTGEGGSAGSDETSTGGTPSGPNTLNQSGNPVYTLLSNFVTWLSTGGTEDTRLAADSELADNILTWQLPHGGFYKNALSVYQAPWNGSASRSSWRGENGVELGTIDNDATVTELMVLADVYQRSGNTAYRDGARAALDFLLTMQLESGGFPQVYPARDGTTYSNYVTFNDDAMVRALTLLLEVTQDAPPVNGDLFTDEERTAAQSAIESAVGYILSSQIEQDGEKTVWCAQHDPDTYEPRGARSYELPSKSGKESVGVVGFLMTQPQTDEVKDAVEAALAWYRSPDVQIEDTAYVSRPSASTDDDYNPIQPTPDKTMWCRFYDLDQEVCFFSGRLPTDNPPGTGKQYDIMDIEPERRYGYQWGGSYGTKLLEYADSVGY